MGILEKRGWDNSYCCINGSNDFHSTSRDLRLSIILIDITFRLKSYSYSLLSSSWSSGSMSTANWCLNFLSLSSPFFLRRACSKCPCLPQKLHVASLAGHLSRGWASSLHQTQDFFPPDFLCPGFGLGLYCLFLNPFLGLVHVKNWHEYRWVLLTFAWWLHRLRVLAWALSTMRKLVLSGNSAWRYKSKIREW